MKSFSHYCLIILALVLGSSLINPGDSLFAQQGIFQPGDYKDGIYDKENANNRRFIPYTHLREADVTWEKRVWREIDLREKQNHSLYFPITNDVLGRPSFVQLVVKSVLGKKIIPFNDESFADPYDLEKLRARFVIPGDTVEAPQYDEQGNETMVKTVKPPDSTWYYDRFCSIQIKEDWYFDRQKSALDVRILGIGLNFVPYGKDDAGCQNFFWVYFPACRPVFAKNEVFNTRNDSERRTYDDIFWKRQFSSRVMKESNVFDRFINDYAKGIDALLESDRIKMDIFKFEHDLWHF